MAVGAPRRPMPKRSLCGWVNGTAQRIWLHHVWQERRQGQPCLACLVKLLFDRGGCPCGAAAWRPLPHAFELSPDLPQREAWVGHGDTGDQRHEAVLRALAWGRAEEGRVRHVLRHEFT